MTTVGISLVETILSERTTVRLSASYSGSRIGLASSWSEKDGVLCSLLDGFPVQLPVADMICDLLLPEKWTPLKPEETAQQTFDGRAASAGLWARFHVEHLCKRNEARIRRFHAWIVPASRHDDQVLGRLPILSWVERFGVVRIAPLARWSKESIRDKIRRERIPCDLFLDPEKEPEQAEKEPIVESDPYDDFLFEPDPAEEGALALS